MSAKQMTLTGVPVEDEAPKTRGATHGVCCLLEAMTVEEFDAVLAEELDVDELYQKYGVER